MQPWLAGTLAKQNKSITKSSFAKAKLAAHFPF
jgi:hypothetical protein